MPRPKNPVPSYRLHKQSGQAVVTVSVNGSRKDMMLGRYNSPESKEEYRRVLKDLEAGRITIAAPTDITVNELCLKFWKHAEEYYRGADGKPVRETLGTARASGTRNRRTIPMLRIVQQSNSAAAKDYFFKADYYADGAELPGVWGGRGAAVLGLSGEVAREDFYALCDNHDPLVRWSTCCR